LRFFIVLVGLWGGFAGIVEAKVIPVSTVAEVTAAIARANSGDKIVLQPGQYAFDLVRVKRPGTRTNPITITAEQRGTVLLKSRAVILFKVRAANWIFENLDIRGVCVPQKKCHHAFQLIGKSNNTIIRNNRMRDFNATIKSGGTWIKRPDGTKIRSYPANVLIEGNAIYNTRARRTSAPVTLIDVVGGKGWVVRRNLIADFEKAGGNKISYAMFLKGNSRDGLIEQNLVVCEWRHSGGVRLGLSLGGGGTGKKYCVNQDCRVEHTNGIIRNNIILNCPRDVGIYLNRAKDAKIYNNTSFNTGSGVDVRFSASRAKVSNNIFSGAVRDRNGGMHTGVRNLDSRDFSAREGIFKDPGKGDLTLKNGGKIVDKAVKLRAVTNDFCGNPRNKGKPDIGAIEYGAGPCDPSEMLRAAENYGKSFGKR
jgi:parallel beta-helix repeat protein